MAKRSFVDTSPVIRKSFSGGFQIFEHHNSSTSIAVKLPELEHSIEVAMYKPEFYS